MKYTAYLIVILLVVFVQCKKEDDNIIEKKFQDYIIAGDSINCSFHLFNYTTNDLDDGDSIPYWSSSSSGGSITTPIDINNDNEFDIRFGDHDYLINHYLINRGLFISNNYGNATNIEFAIWERDTLGINNDTIKIAVLFNKSDTISNNQRWIQSANPKISKSVYYVSYYYDFEYKNLLRFPSDSAPLVGQELYINEMAKDKYIGIRKKSGDQYIYGWIRCSFENYECLKLTSSAFADK